MSGPTTLLPFRAATMTSAQLAAVSFLARYSGQTHRPYAYQLREWFAWCESIGEDPLVGGRLRVKRHGLAGSGAPRVGRGRIAPSSRRAGPLAAVDRREQAPIGWPPDRRSST